MLTYDAAGVGLDDVVEWAAQTGVAAIAGVVVGLVFFPFKWIAGAVTRRRDAVLTACREAHRVLRTAELDNRYPLFATSTDEERGVALRDRVTATRRAWDEAVGYLEASPAKDVYGVVSRLMFLSQRAPAVEHAWGPQGDPDDFDMGEAIHVRSAIEALEVKIQHRWRRFPAAKYHEEADGLEKTIQEAEDELEWRHQQQMEAWRESRAEQAAAKAAAGTQGEGSTS